MQPSEPAVEVLQEASSLGIVEISDEIRRACRIDDPNAYFALDFQALRGDQDLPGLNKVAACFISGPLGGRTMKLVGHSDPQGTSMLGQAWADSVARYFDGHGLTKSRLKTISRGAMDATSADEATRPRERGVDIVLGP
jgi:peptidoglycan-associated lipoprotein